MSGYDYVVVGAGSAGCVLAARLTEDPGCRVALIEAGRPDTDQEIHVPAAVPQLFKGDLDWDLDSEPEPGLSGRRVYLPRGKVFGGCSSINAMIYIRGHRADYDGWAAAGAEGWSYAEVLPYFRRAEDNERGADEFHGTGGPLTVSEGRSEHPLVTAFLRAAEQAGHKSTDDFNGPSPLGVGRYQVTQRGGLRCSAAVAYLHPALERPNLTVLSGTRAHRVLVESGRATGVEVRRAGSTTVETVRAEREVILSAGAYESPKLLMLSGIGPAPTLSALGIDVVCDLPVGQGLQDHYMVLLNYRTDVTSLLTEAATPASLSLLETEGRGPLTSNIAEAGGFFRSREHLDAPDVQFHMAPVLFHQEGLAAVTEDGFALGPCVLAPTSRGEVTLRSVRPDAAPRITHRYLTTAEDRDAIVQGLGAALDIAAQPALAALATGPFDVPASDAAEDLLDFARRAGQSLYHPTSTCAIGSVVDPALRVLGVEGLRVVDASVFPTVPRGNTNAPVIMAAEKAADLLKEVAPA